MTTEREIEVAPNWLSATEESRDEVLRSLKNEEWRAEKMEISQNEPSLGDERIWCDRDIFEMLCEAKRLLNEHDSESIEKVRERSNPHEPLLKNKAMMGRMSLLLASIDRVFDFLLTDENIEDAETKCPLNVSVRGTNIDREKELFYFAETQSMNIPFASHYVLLRKGFYNAKCFIPRSVQEGSPLVSLAFIDTIAKRDSKIYNAALNPFISKTRNDFSNLVHHGTRGQGVHLYAGFTHNIYNFSITNRDQSRGDQGQKEMLFRHSYLGQLFYASSIVRSGGRAILQFLDTNTSTSVAVLYLAHIIFDRVSIYKPNMSRPANAEKFLICDGLRSREAKAVHKYLKSTMDTMKEDESIRRLIPDRIMDKDDNFMDYFTTANKCLAERQNKFLSSYLRMLGDDSRENTHQRDCLNTCLPYYLIPYINPASKSSLYKKNKAQTAEDVLYSILPEGMTQQNFLRRLSNQLPKFSMKGLAEKLNNNHQYLLTSCAEQTASLIVATNNGIFYGDKGRFVELASDIFLLPQDTVILGDFFEINRRGTLVVRILDVAIIYGDNVSNLPLKKRLHAAEKLTEACRKNGNKTEFIFTVARYETLRNGWKPDSNSSNVVEGSFNFERVKYRIVEDSSKTFFDLCRGDGVWDM